MNQCDVCLRTDAPSLAPLLSSHQTPEIKEVCPNCERVLNAHKSKLQHATSKILLDWFKQFMEQRRAAAEVQRRKG